MDFNWPAIVGLVSWLWGGVPADIGNSPQSLLEAIYNPPATAESTLTADEVYSDRLQTLFASYFAEEQTILASTAGEPPPINLIPFDPLSLVTAPGDVSISVPVVTGAQATATVGFTGEDGPVQLSLFMIEQQDGWRIDDVASFNANGQQWLLSWILRYDPPMID